MKKNVKIRNQRTFSGFFWTSKTHMVHVQVTLKCAITQQRGVKVAVIATMIPVSSELNCISSAFNAAIKRKVKAARPFGVFGKSTH